MDITFNYKNLSPFIKKFKINNKLVLINYFNKTDNLELIYEITDYKFNILDAKVKNIKILIDNKNIEANYYNLGDTRIIRFILDKDQKEYLIDYVRLYSNIKDININTYFSKIFVISLKHENKNKEIITNLFNNFKINFEFFEATYGKEDKECLKILNNYQKEPICGKNSHILENKLGKKLLTNLGEVGYLKSWENIISQAINENLNSILIFDDDVILHKNFNLLIMDYLYYINKYKIINLGNTEFCNKDLIDFKQINDNLSYYNCTDLTDGSFAVGIHNSIYKELLELIKRYNAPLDTGCLRDLYLKYPKECYSCSPNLAIAWVGKNGIHDKKDIYKNAKKINWNLNNYDWFPYYDETIVLFYVIDTYIKLEEVHNILKTFNKSNYKIYLVNMLDIEFKFKNLNLEIIEINHMFNYIKNCSFFSFLNSFDLDLINKNIQMLINNNQLIYLKKNNGLNIYINNLEISLLDSIFASNNFIKYIDWTKNDFNTLDFIKNYILFILKIKENDFSFSINNYKIKFGK